MTLPGWTREPLVHFLVAGAALYVALTWGGTPVDPASRVIDVGAEEQAQIALTFERTMGRAPTDAELDAALDRYVRDAVVRQRMVSKMDMSAGLATEAADANEATLRAYFDANAERYSGGAVVTFEQAFFESQLAARSARASGVVSGEAISLPAALIDVREREVQNRFGEQFSRELAALQPDDSWQGPVQSGFGWHLVKLKDRTALPGDFDAVRERVENDWRTDEMAARKARAFEILRSAYRVEIDR
jgi:hypothetical protein